MGKVTHALQTITKLREMISAPLAEPSDKQARVDEEFNMFLEGIDELMRATLASRRTELEIVTDGDRTAADVILTGMLEIKSIDKQRKNQSVTGEVCVQTTRLTAKWKTVKARATRARAVSDEPFQRKKYAKRIGRALQLRKLVKKTVGR